MSDPSLRQRTNASPTSAFSLGAPVDAPFNGNTPTSASTHNDGDVGSYQQDQVRVPLPSSSQSQSQSQSGYSSQTQSTGNSAPPNSTSYPAVEPYTDTDPDSKSFQTTKNTFGNNPLSAKIEQIKLPVSGQTFLGVPMATITLALTLLGTAGMGWYLYNNVLGSGGITSGRF
ncbi:hypothetical protein CI109_102373 [Kwoniella shandongensis]|uniref:Uncharacterized protein n=1 Tax=Kwoniella shandongensis TaxID=1734106 RepID=A0A5M6BZU6_9TREE|nr:uncharacterized protein CI109_003307 [Kwoniella shandongensis]KAA5528407.1 hypothetical protein CI109_003307 [Kwoniella shandongensis]